MNVAFRCVAMVDCCMVTYLDCRDFEGLHCLELDFVPSTGWGLALAIDRTFASYWTVDRDYRAVTEPTFASHLIAEQSYRAVIGLTFQLAIKFVAIVAAPKMSIRIINIYFFDQR